MKAWHFISPDFKLGHDDRRIVAVCEKIKYMPSCLNRSRCRYRCQRRRRCPQQYPYHSYEPRPLTLCESGMHASKQIKQAMAYAKSHWILTRVELEGDIIEGEAMFVAEYRTILYSTRLPLDSLVSLAHLEVVQESREFVDTLQEGRDYLHNPNIETTRQLTLALNRLAQNGNSLTKKLQDNLIYIPEKYYTKAVKRHLGRKEL